MRVENHALNQKLIAAAKEGDAALVAELLGMGANPLATSIDSTLPIGHAAWRGHAACVEALAPASELDTAKRAGLMGLAARKDSVECLRVLMSKEACAHRDSKGATPLIVAAMRGAAACVREMLPWSDPLAKDADGETALTMATMNGRGECMGILLAVSDLDAVGGSGRGIEELANLCCSRQLAEMVRGCRLARSEAKELANVAEGAARRNRRSSI